MKTISELYEHYIKKYPHLKPKQTKKTKKTKKKD
jgi:hypothetical protein